MIPQNITKAHVLLAIEEVRQKGIPEQDHSKHYSVYFEEKLYPPKLLISCANRHANGVALPSKDFSSEEQSNNLLRSLGFQIVVQSTLGKIYPLESFSWKLESETVAIKTTDKSCFCHHGTGIPAAIYWFFGIDKKLESADWNVLLRCQGKKYKGHLQQDITLKRWRLFWKAEFDECLRHACPDWYAAFQKEDEPQGKAPLLRFCPLNESYNEYEIEILLQDALADDVENGLPDAIPTSPESFTSTTGSPEGGKQAYQGTRYERDLGNRRRAIEIHGTRCIACQFDFGETYGSHGIGFIEIHHLHPLYVKGEEHPVDPKEDLRPICSNCHRMIHRKKQSIMTIEELKNILRQPK